MCLDNCLDDSPTEEPYEAISWDIYNLQYGSPKSRSQKFHIINRMMPQILEEMTVFERSELIRLVLRQQDRRIRLGMSDFGISDISLLTLQSETVIDAGASITDNANAIVTDSGEQEVIVRYLDETPGTLVAHNKILDKTFTGDFVEDHSLSKYLSRPISISTISWAEGANLSTNFQPWDLFFNTLQVRKKIDNYARINCNLHIKVILNASPFFYGAGIVSYEPLTNFNPTTIHTSLTVNGNAYICAQSQRPHIWIYPQTNQGGELVLPFLNYRSWLNVNDRSEFQRMGTIYVQSPTALLNANSVAAANVTVQIYAWATDVKVCGPTSTLALQSGEYGLVSGPASSVAKIARSLSAVPMIAPYARATEMISSGIGSLAKLFGFTNVPVLEDVKPMKNLPFHAFASCEISQPIEKLTIDPKNELTIDSRVCGHDGIDELLLSNFIQREAYVIQATWAAAHTTGQVLIRANITPDTKVLETHTIPFIQGTPMSHANTLFRYWRGDIIYRFRFICSKFHRGRVLIQWDPQTGLTAAKDTNLIHSQIVDISTDTDVEFRVPYLAEQMFLRNSGNPDTAASYQTSNIVSTGAISSNDARLHNGSLIISVLTQQTSPVTSADIIILGSVRAADNVVFGMPQQPPPFHSLFALQSEEIDVGASTGAFSYDTTGHYDLTSNSPILDDESFTICMGERITSLRQLMRRVTYHRSWMLTATPSATVLNGYYSTHARLPLAFGYDPNGIDVADSTLVPGNNKAFNFVYNTAITFISTCFIGHRGAINWHYNIDDTNWSNSVTAHRLVGVTTTAANYKATFTPSIASSSNYSRTNMANREAGGQGCCLNNVRTQAGISVQYPLYSLYRMQSPNATTLVLGTSADESDLDHCKLEVSLQPHTASNLALPAVDFYVGCGTDFTCIFFLNVPTYLDYGLIPAAV